MLRLYVMVRRLKGNKKKMELLTMAFLLTGTLPPPLSTSEGHITFTLREMSSLFQSNEGWSKLSAFLTWLTQEALAGSRSPHILRVRMTQGCLSPVPKQASGAGSWDCQWSQVNCNLIPSTTGDRPELPQKDMGEMPFHKLRLCFSRAGVWSFQKVLRMPRAHVKSTIKWANANTWPHRKLLNANSAPTCLRWSKSVPYWGGCWRLITFNVI